jgi:hypothetical protein
LRPVQRGVVAPHQVKQVVAGSHLGDAERCRDDTIDA